MRNKLCMYSTYTGMSHVIQWHQLTKLSTYIALPRKSVGIFFTVTGYRRQSGDIIYLTIGTNYAQ